MRALMAGSNDRKVNLPARGERVAAFVEEHLNYHKGLSLSELAFRIRADKRDLQRLIRDRSVGHALEDALAAYFGPVFGYAVFGDLWGSGPSKRERELEQERAELAARRERLERLREADRMAAADARDGRRVAADQGRSASV
jgi:hypothetical protein